MKRTLTLLALCLTMCASFAQQAELLYRGNRNYQLVERTDLLRYDNGKYTGLVSREVRSFITNTGTFYDGSFYVLQQTKHDARSVNSGINDSIPSQFTIDEDGDLCMVTDNGYPSFRSFPAFTSQKVSLGQSWHASAERAVDPLEKGIFTILPLYVEYTYTGDTVSDSGEEVYVITARWATRYGNGVYDEQGDPDLVKAAGSHEATMHVSKATGTALVVRDRTDEQFTYADGRTVRLKGTISLFTKYPPVIDRSKIFPALQRAGILSAEESEQFVSGWVSGAGNGNTSGASGGTSGGKRPVSAVNRASGTELMISEQLAQEIKDVINASMQVSKRERAKSVDVFLKEVSFSEQSINTSVESVAKDEETIIASEELERDRSFEMLLKRAESGDAEAQEILISRYNYGVGVWKKNDDTEKKGNSDESRRYGSNRGSDYQTYVSLKGTNGWYKVLAFCVTFIPFLFFWSYNFHNIISFLKSYFTNTWAAFVFWWLLPEFALSLWYPLRGAICYIINRNNPRLSYHGIIVTEFLEEERNWRNWIPLIIFNIIVLIIFVYVNAIS